MNPCELTMAAAALANTISRGLSIDEINLLGTIFTQIGDTLLTIAAQKTLCDNTKD